MKQILIRSTFLCVTLLAVLGAADAQALAQKNNDKSVQTADKAQASANGSSAAQKPVLDSPNALTEGFVFYIQDYKYQHQSELNNLNITIRYTYVPGITESQYPEFRLILNDIKMFLVNYQDEEAYWEVLNKAVTEMVLRRYPVIASITSEMQVSPSPMITYLRASTVTRQRAGR
ncbi:MAG TPA: hypothetical protein VMZ26_09700 [Pyrinomonadaceae bacterium]|nr:hypothetical protein [Pyrinomonadaceae bacterium]